MIRFGESGSAAPPTGHRGVLVYVSLIACLGAGVIGHALWQLTRTPFDPQWLWFAALTVVSSTAVLQLSTGRIAFSVTEIFTFSAVLLFGPGIGALTVAIDCAVMSLRLAVRGRPLRRTVLSISAPTLAMWIAAQVLTALTDAGSRAGSPLSFSTLWQPLAVSAVIYYLLDTWMIAIAVALDERTPLWRLWRDHFAQLWISFVVGAYAAGLVVVTINDLGWSFFALVAPLPVLLYYALRTWVARVNEQVLHLQQMHTQSQILHEQQTLRLRSEIALRERDRQFQAVFDAALDALLLVDDDRRVVSANATACGLLGVARDQLPSAPLDSFLAAASSDEMREHWDRQLERGEHQGELVTFTGGRERIIEFSFKAEIVANRHLFVWRDVSDRRRLEAQLQQSQKMETLGRLAGGLAHDFNNLLTVILGNAELVRDDGEVEEGIREIMLATERAAMLTRQLLAFSRKQQLAMNVVNLNGIVGGVDRMLRRLVDESFAFTTVMDAEIWPVKVDVTQLEQVIVNLVVNARDAMPDGGPLVLSTANVDLALPRADCSGVDIAPGCYAVLSVADSGCGMDRETQAQIFEPFFTTKPHDRGTGLGLSIVYGIVRQSGGHIVVESRLGAGSTFSIYLPRVEQPDPCATRETTRPVVALGGSETVLLVEDEDAVRALARRTLQRYGYTVLTAAGGDEGLQLAMTEAPIDLLVTDVVMPGMNGRDLAAALRADNSRLKVIFLSGYTSAAVTEEVATAGTAFLQKPFSPAELARGVRQLLDTSSGRARPIGAGRGR